MISWFVSGEHPDYFLTLLSKNTAVMDTIFFVFKIVLGLISVWQIFLFLHTWRSLRCDSGLFQTRSLFKNWSAPERTQDEKSKQSSTIEKNQLSRSSRERWRAMIDWSRETIMNHRHLPQHEFCHLQLIKEGPESEKNHNEREREREKKNHANLFLFCGDVFASDSRSPLHLYFFNFIMHIYIIISENICLQKTNHLSVMK